VKELVEADGEFWKLRK